MAFTVVIVRHWLPPWEMGLTQGTFAPLTRAGLMQLLEASAHNYVRWRNADDSMHKRRKAHISGQSVTVMRLQAGGRSVSTVAAESTAAGSRFWIAANKNKSFVHFQWVLEELKSFCNASPQPKMEIQNSIVAKTICFSKEKVKTHGRYLCISIKKAIQSLPDPNYDAARRSSRPTWWAPYNQARCMSAWVLTDTVKWAGIAVAPVISHIL